MAIHRLAESEALFARAQSVIPDGIYGHQSPKMMVAGAHPYFFERSLGCRVWDVDGNEYIDYMCSYGPIVLGHNHPAVDEAALQQMKKGRCFSAPGRVWVELAEHLVETTPFSDWAVFAKNGSDVCSWALAVARQATGRRKIVMATGAYHGVHGWCNPFPTGFTPEDRANVLTFEYNNLENLRSVVSAERGEIAAIIVTPFRHDAFHDQELPAEGFLPGVRSLCDQIGAVFVMDDVRAGFRLHLGGSGELFGVRPDLGCYAKALANGYALAACLGRESLREAAKQVFFTGSYFTNPIPMAAALACLREMRATGAAEKMRTTGEMLRRGIEEQAGGHGIAITYSGPAAIPFMTFRDDEGFEKSRVFSAACARQGVYLAPYHNWFLSTAHHEADIRQTLEVTDRAFAEVRRMAA
jgi:glutamate-1-semialdehyde 2,1-aminomutase